jgi:hypothetical protein
LFCWPPQFWPQFLGGDPSSGCSWGMPEILIILFGVVSIFAIGYTTVSGGKKAHFALERKALKRRKAKAEKYRAKAKALEAKGLGGIFA